MKNNIFIFSASAVFFFYSGFYANQYMPPPLPIVNNIALNNAVNDKASHIVISKKLTKPKINTQLNIGVKNTPSNIKEEEIPPHEREQFETTKQEREELFYINQEAEIEFYETLLISMKENNLAEVDIAEIKDNINQINSAQFVDNVVEQDEYLEEITISKMREDLSESLYQSGDLSDEEIKKMALYMFPDDDNSEDSIIASEDDDTSIPLHEFESQ